MGLESLLAEGGDPSDAVELVAMQAMLSEYDSSVATMSELQESYAALMQQILSDIS